MPKIWIHKLNSRLIKLPTPINISYWWNFGSLLGLLLLIQFLRGILLSLHYCPNINIAFESIIHILQNVNNGWIIRNTHMNGASIFFICLYIHLGRNLFYHSFNLKYTWLAGVTIFILSIATAFLGYVLPWGQISFWGATVITNLLTTIPYLGTSIVEWLWGGFAINNATLTRFFSFHFLIPFLIMVFVFIHLFFLHRTGSKNPLGVRSNFNKIPFHIYFTLKDITGFLIIRIILTLIICQYPYRLRDPDNFIQANPLSTPTHIQPEWYFLFAYAILRSIPNKLGGVIALVRSIIILYTYKWTRYHYKTNLFYPLNQLLYWIFINIFIILTYLGSQIIEPPYINIRLIFTMIYFIYFPRIHFTSKLWDSIITFSLKKT